GARPRAGHRGARRLVAQGPGRGGRAVHLAAPAHARRAALAGARGRGARQGLAAQASRGAGGLRGGGASAGGGGLRDGPELGRRAARGTPQLRASEELAYGAATGETAVLLRRRTPRAGGGPAGERGLR